MMKQTVAFLALNVSGLEIPHVQHHLSSLLNASGWMGLMSVMKPKHTYYDDEWLIVRKSSFSRFVWSHDGACCRLS
jgi:hypothetical protein